MITPADLARMLSHAADDAGDHTQTASDGTMNRRPRRPEEPSKLMYSTATRTPAAKQSAQQSAQRPAAKSAKSAPADPTGKPAVPKPGPHIVAAFPKPGPHLHEPPAIVRGEDEIEESLILGTGVGTGSDVQPQTPRTPTPAMMPPRRAQDGPSTFASLDAQELPVVREYSAGGLIFDDRGRVAIIARHSRSGHLEWCLPKGHIEKGETPEQTAVREVHEETGILGEVIESIATIDYWFTGTSQRVHKLVHHYALRRVGGELTVDGDPDHEAEDAIWVDFNDLDDVLSYPNERKIAWLYARKTKKQA